MSGGGGGGVYVNTRGLLSSAARVDERAYGALTKSPPRAT